MNFISIFTRLFYDRSQYRLVAFQSPKQTLGTVLTYYVLLSVGAAVVTSIYFLPQFESFTERLNDTLTTSIPKQATLTLEQNTLQTTNLPQPTTFTTPPVPGIGQQLEVFLDTSLDLPDLATASGHLRIGRHGVRFQPPQQDISSIEKYADLFPNQPISLTGDELHHQFNQSLELYNQTKWLIPILVMIVVAIILFLTRTITTLIYSLMLTLGGLLVNRPYPFKAYVNLMYHVAIVVDTLTLLIFLIYRQSFPGINQIALIGMTLLALFSLPPAKIND